MNSEAPAYGLWFLVIFNSAIFLMFAYSFFKPQTARDWRTYSAFAAFIVALLVVQHSFCKLFLIGRRAKRATPRNSGTEFHWHSSLPKQRRYRKNPLHDATNRH